jgi:glycosyltransferase involved in cell wall biosynthesis
MRVLHCIWRMGIGGAERQLGYLAHGLVRRGIDVHVALVFRGAYAAALEDAGACVHQLVGSKRDPLVLPRLAVLCRQLKPAVLHTWLTQMDILGGISAKMARTPWILSERASELSYPPSLLNATRRSLGVGAAAVVANSQAGADYWRKVGANGAVHIIKNIVPIERIAQARLSDEPSSLPSDLPTVLFVGRLTPEKNVSTLLQAIAIISKQSRLTAVICGDGILRPQLEQQAKDLAISPFTVFLGAVTNPWPLMQRATVLVSASFFEGSPNVVLEAMAGATPLVLSNVPAHRAIADDASALFADPHSPDDLAAKILAVITDRTNAARRAKIAQASLGARSEDNIAEQYEFVYRQIGARSNAIGKA